jgi:hypothetical protein
MIITRNYNDLTKDEFINEYVNKNKPCLIKNFLQDKEDACSKKYYTNYIKEHTIINTKGGGFDVSRGDETFNCKNKIVDEILNNDNFIMGNFARLWLHSKGTITNWHYDGNGSDILNISISGAKRFWLSKPNSYPTYPLTNIANGDHVAEYIVDLMPNDMLYIPAYWFHKVETLEDETLNVNYLFFNKKTTHMHINNKQLYNVHDMLNTAMCEDPICDIARDDKIKFSSFGKILSDSIIYLFIYLIFYIMLNKYNETYNKIYAGSLFMLFLVIFSMQEIDYHTSGVSKLLSTTMLFYIILVEFVRDIAF